MAQVTIYGVGLDELTGKTTLNKTLEMEDTMARKIFGPKKKQLIQKILQEHCPDITISPDEVGIQIIYKRINTIFNKESN